MAQMMMMMMTMMTMMMMTRTRISLHSPRWQYLVTDWIQKLDADLKCRLQLTFDWIFLLFCLIVYICVSTCSNIHTYATGWPCGQANGRHPGRAPCQVFLFVKILPRSFTFTFRGIFWHFHFSGNFLALSLCRELRLRAGMFNDHMPWGYQVNSFKIQETR